MLNSRPKLNSALPEQRINMPGPVEGGGDSSHLTTANSALASREEAMPGQATDTSIPAPAPAPSASAGNQLSQTTSGTTQTSRGEMSSPATAKNQSLQVGQPTGALDSTSVSGEAEMPGQATGLDVRITTPSRSPALASAEIYVSQVTTEADNPEQGPAARAAITTDRNQSSNIQTTASVHICRLI